MTSTTLDTHFDAGFDTGFYVGPAPRSVRPCPPTTDAEVHLTRRGRLLVFVVALLVVLASVFWLFGPTSAAIEHPEPSQRTRVVVVGTGETLWDIASDVSVDGATGQMVDRLVRLNDLGSGMVVAGQRLVVPVGG